MRGRNAGMMGLTPLEKLHRVAGRIVEQDLLATTTRDDLTA
jgi:hypothetical protein